MVNNHSIAFSCFNNVVIDHCDTLVVPHQLLKDLLCFKFGLWLAYLYLSSPILLICLDIHYSDTGARSFRYCVSVAAKLIDVQVGQHDAGFGWSTDP